VCAIHLPRAEKVVEEVETAAEPAEGASEEDK